MTAPSASTERAHQAAKRYIYAWGGGRAEGDATMRDLLGGKGAGLAEMCRIGLPVPPGFTITTDVCTYYYDHKRTYPAALKAQMQAGVASIEKQTGKKFGDTKNPLLVSVRSGARSSMPGMMDTILNLGLTSRTLPGLAALSGERFALDCRRRFIEMYSNVVLRVPRHHFEEVLTAKKKERGVSSDTELAAGDLAEALPAAIERVRGEGGRPSASS